MNKNSSSSLASSFSPLVEKVSSFFIGFLPTTPEVATDLNAKIVEGNLAVQAAHSAQEQAKAEQERAKAERERIDVEKQQTFLLHYKQREDAEAEATVSRIKVKGTVEVEQEGTKLANAKRERANAEWDAEKTSRAITEKREALDRQAQLTAIQSLDKHRRDMEDAAESAKSETLRHQAKLEHRLACDQLDKEETDLRNKDDILTRQAKLECLPETIRMEKERDYNLLLLQIEQRKLEREEQRRREEQELAERRRRDDYELQVNRLKTRQSEIKEDFTSESILLTLKTVRTGSRKERRERRESQTK